MALTLVTKGRTLRLRGSRWVRWSGSAVPYLFVLPAIILYLVFKVVPVVGGFYLALLQWDGLNPPKFVGLQNFADMLNDKLIALALLHNVQYAAGTVTLKLSISLLLALLVNQGLRLRGFYRTALFMPVVMSFVVVSVLWSWMLDYRVGLINRILSAIGLGSLIRSWLADPKIVLKTLMVVDVWKWYGFHMVIFLAGLQTINVELYEAARIDGASRWQQFKSITLPLLQPVMLVNLTMCLTGAFGVFDIPFVMTEGGPGNATLVLALHIYIRGFKFYKFGYGTAMSYALTLLIAIITAIEVKLMSRGIAGS